MEGNLPYPKTWIQLRHVVEEIKNHQQSQIPLTMQKEEWRDRYLLKKELKLGTQEGWKNLNGTRNRSNSEESNHR